MKIAKHHENECVETIFDFSSWILFELLTDIIYRNVTIQTVSNFMSNHQLAFFFERNEKFRAKAPMLITHDCFDIKLLNLS